MELLDGIRQLLAGYDWKAVMAAGGRRPFLVASTGAVNYVRSAETPGNQVADGEETLAAQFRRQAGRLARAWALCAGSDALEPVQPEVQFYEESGCGWPNSTRMRASLRGSRFRRRSNDCWPT